MTTSAMHQVPQSSPSFGHEFSYASWTPGTDVTLCNVPWNSDYRDVVRFDNRTKLDEYIKNQTGPKVEIKGMTYAKVGQPVRLGITFNNAYRYNYLRAYNPAQPVAGGDTGRAYYYFITDVRYVAPDTTELLVQLDVWQTFGYDVTFGNCYIERGHVGIANTKGFDDYGREFLTLPEGLDIGGEYNIVDRWSEQIATARGDTPDYDIMVTSTVSLTDAAGTVEAPVLNTAKGSFMENLPNGATTYIFDSLAEFKNFMEGFSDKPWVTQGIIGINAIPPHTRYNISLKPAVSISGTTLHEVDTGSPNFTQRPMNISWRNKLPIPERYRRLKKFFTYPYTVLEMTSYTGTPLVLKPESWNDPSATVVEVPHFSQPSPRVVFYPRNYNADDSSTEIDEYGDPVDHGEFLDMMTGIFNFPSFSLVNNGYMSFMASNNAGIQYQHQSADWSQQKALTGNQLGYDQSSAAMDLSRQQTALGINAAQQSTSLANETAGFRAIQGIANGVIGAAGGGIGGAVNGAVGLANTAAGYAIDVNQNNKSLGISTNLAQQSNNASVGNQGFVRDTNKDYADYATKGDYQNTIAAINAKVQDARMIQPTTSGQVGGDAFNLATYKWGYDIKVKMLQGAAMAAIGEYWLRYGYAVQRFGKMPVSFMAMEKFTYWKLRETYITSSACPETFKQAIRGIFEKGVTVWKNPDDIGMIDIGDNIPLGGITL